MNLRSFLISGMLACIPFFGAHADPYRMWASEVSKATKGLSICREAYSKAVGFGRSESEMRKQVAEALNTCAVLKSHFETTMLAVKMNVNGIDEPLESYSQLVRAGFEQLAPKTKPDPLKYYTESLGTVVTIEKMQLKLIALDGGW